MNYSDLLEGFLKACKGKLSKETLTAFKECDNASELIAEVAMRILITKGDHGKAAAYILTTTF